MTVAALAILLLAAGCASSTRQASVTVTARVRLGGAPIGVAPGRGALWVLTCARDCNPPGSNPPGSGAGELVEVASAGRVLARFPVADPGALAVGGGGVWIAHSPSGVVMRVDPATGATTAVVHLSLPVPVVPGDRRFLPSGISVGDGEVWVSTARGWLAEIDTRTSRLVALVRSPSEDNVPAVEGHNVWVAENLDGVGVIRPPSSRLAIHGLSYAGQSVDVYELAAGGGLVWTLGSALAAVPPPHNVTVLTAIDARTGAVVRRVPVPGASSIAAGGRKLYVGDFERGRVLGIDGRSGIRALRAPRTDWTLRATTPGALWATDSDELLRLRLG